jgi:hypothetical protein
MKKAIILAVLFFFVLGSGVALATDVGGIITNDTTWTEAGSPYNIVSNIQISEGVTLTIADGVIVNGVNSGLTIVVFGTLSAVGTESSRIVFKDFQIETPEGGSDGEIYIAYSELNNVGLIPRRGSIITLRDSTTKWSLGYSGGISGNNSNGLIERNVFIGGGGIYTSQSNVTVRNNVFYEQTTDHAAVTSYNSVVLAEYNSFLSTDRIALKLDWDGQITAVNNFWNTTDTSVIEAMIYDCYDDLNIANCIDYSSFRTAPHPDTPIPDFNQSPVADAGEYEPVFDTITLDGRDSYDPDGSIDSYEWKLQHRGDSAYNRIASGENPTVTDLAPGWYDAFLIITDDLGGIAQDSTLVAAAGPCVLTDLDGDGYSVEQGDCNDYDPEINPGAVELPGNTVDENCDDSLGCDPTAEWQNHGQFVGCVSQVVEQLVSSGAISEEEGTMLIDSAATSDVGK